MLHTHFSLRGVERGGERVEVFEDAPSAFRKRLDAQGGLARRAGDGGLVEPGSELTEAGHEGAELLADFARPLADEREVFVEAVVIGLRGGLICSRQVFLP